MDNKLQKSLTDLIDETLQELDELRKSRFSASEIKIEGPGDGIAGKPSDGKLDAAKAEDKKEDEDKDMDKAEDKKEDDPADSEKTKADLKSLLGKKEDEEEDEEEDEDDEKHPKKKETADAAKDILDMHKGEMKKSLEETESLMKSYVEERVKPLEDKLSTILNLVNQIADQPVAPKGVTAREVAPLLKSGDASFEPLSKAQVASKLFELKKSGTKVDSLDITKAEMGQDLQTIVKKYEIS